MAGSFSFGERAVINLFRGAGGLLGSSGSGESGMDTLNSRLQDTFQDYFWVSQVHPSYEGDVFSFREIGSQRARAFTDQYDLVQAQGAVGYSAGGLSAIRLAQGGAPQGFDLVVQIESFDPLTGSSPEDETLPTNVAQGINYYQSANRFNPFGPGFDPFDLQGAQAVQGAENINAESLFSDRTLTHRNIEDSASLQNQILQDIERYVLQDLRFDRAGQLTLAGGAQPVNNILALRPDGSQGGGSGFIDTPIAIGDNVSFQSRFEFRLPPANAEGVPGLSFWIQPAGEFTVGAAQSSLVVSFEPLALNAAPAVGNAVGIFTPDLVATPLTQAVANLDLDSGQPLTAWVEYDGPTDRLDVYLDDSLIQPSAPLLSLGVDLPAVVGPQASFGFQSVVEGEARQADLFTWQLTTTGEVEPPLANGVVDKKRMPFDYNGDGKTDIAFFRTFPETGATVAEIGLWLLDGLDAPGAPVAVDRYPFQGAAEDWRPALPQRNLDFNGDGKTDILFNRLNRSLTAGEAEFELGLWLMDGTVPLDQSVIATVASNDWENPLTYQSFDARLPLGDLGRGPFGDFNGDGKTDLLFLASPTATGERDLAIWLMDGMTPTTQAVVDRFGGGWSPININDFNGDGKDDLLFERTLENGALGHGIWLMDSVTPISQAALGSIPAAEGWALTDTNDFNGDGRADLLFSRESALVPGQSEYAVWLMEGAVIRDRRMIGDSGRDWRLIDHNDFNGDGKADLLFSRTDPSDGDEYGVWLMDGTSVLAQASVDTITTDWSYLASADLNADGRADLTFMNEATRQVAGWLMGGTSTLTQDIVGMYGPGDPADGWLTPFATPAIAATGGL